MILVPVSDSEDSDSGGSSVSCECKDVLEPHEPPHESRHVVIMCGRVTVLSVDGGVCSAVGCVCFAAVGTMGCVVASFGGADGMLSLLLVEDEGCTSGGCSVFVMFAGAGAVVVAWVCSSVESVGGAICCSVGGWRFLEVHLSA